MSIKKFLADNNLEGKPVRTLREEVEMRLRNNLQPNHQISDDVFRQIIQEAFQNVIIKSVVDLVEAFYCRIIHVSLPYGLLSRLNIEGLGIRETTLKKDLLISQISQVFGYDLTDDQLHGFAVSIQNEKIEGEA